MYFLDVINSNNQVERAYIDKDIYLAEYEPTRREKQVILADIVKEVQARNKQRGITPYKAKQNKNRREVIISKAVSMFKHGKKVPVFNDKRATDYTLYSDGTHDYNEVHSQNYNDDYFDFSELKRLM